MVRRVQRRLVTAGSKDDPAIGVTCGFPGARISELDLGVTSPREVVCGRNMNMLYHYVVSGFDRSQWSRKHGLLVFGSVD